MEMKNFNFDNVAFDVDGIREYRIAKEGFNWLMSYTTKEAFEKIEAAVREGKRSVEMPHLWEEDIFLLERLGFHIAQGCKLRKSQFIIFW